MTAEFRVSAMRQFGGKPTTEKAIVAALRWLKTHQNEEGSWSNECKPAMTGLALLCFLGHGELPASPEFGSTVKKALDWLQQKGSESDGRMSLTKGEWLRDVSVYEHALGTQSICEYFAMTQDAAFAALIPKAAAITVDGQNPSGGWDLFFHQGVRSDLSVTAWQVQALHAAWLTKLPIPGLDQALDKSVIYIKAKQGNEGGFGYDRAENRVAFTGMGVISAYLTTQSKDRTVKEGIDYLLGKAEVKYKGGKTQADLYAGISPRRPATDLAARRGRSGMACFRMKSRTTRAPMEAGRRRRVTLIKPRWMEPDPAIAPRFAL